MSLRRGDRLRRAVGRHAFEAPNNAGAAENLPLIVVLNDNDMSISPPVGALRHALGRLTAGRADARSKRQTQTVLDLISTSRCLANLMEAHVKSLVAPTTLFEKLGFNYVGPLDGHDVDERVGALSNMH